MPIDPHTSGSIDRAEHDDAMRPGRRKCGIGLRMEESG